MSLLGLTLNGEYRLNKSVNTCPNCREKGELYICKKDMATFSTSGIHHREYIIGNFACCKRKYFLKSGSGLKAGNIPDENILEEFIESSDKLRIYVWWFLFWTPFLSMIWTIMLLPQRKYINNNYLLSYGLMFLVVLSVNIIWMYILTTG